MKRLFLSTLLIIATTYNLAQDYDFYGSNTQKHKVTIVNQETK